MNHLQTLGSHNNYQYVYLNNCEELENEYNRMYSIIKSNGHALASDTWSLDAGILLKNEQEVVAGSFFNLSKSPTRILIHIIFVEEKCRQQGIYTKMHSLIDRLGKESNRKEIYSYIHADNRIMQEYLIEKIEYKPVMHLMKREIK
jgi:RimJ/RimL family protein N-acetyltransferase